jgi:hypothetical protein
VRAFTAFLEGGYPVSSAVDEKPPARVGFRHVPQRGTVLPSTNETQVPPCWEVQAVRSNLPVAITGQPAHKVIRPGMSGEVTDDVPDDVDAHWTASGIVLTHMMNQPERSGQCQEHAE